MPPLDHELGGAGDWSSRHARDGGDLRVLEAEGVGGDGDLGAGAPATLDGLVGNNETLDVALKELKLDAVVVKVIL